MMVSFCVREDNQGCGPTSSSDDNKRSPNFREYLLTCDARVGNIPGYPRLRRVALQSGQSRVYSPDNGGIFGCNLNPSGGESCAPREGSVIPAAIPAPAPAPRAAAPAAPRIPGATRQAILNGAADGQPVCEERTIRIPAYYANEEDRAAQKLCLNQYLISRLTSMCPLYLNEGNLAAGTRMRVPGGHYINETPDRIVRINGRDCLQHMKIDRLINVCPLYLDGTSDIGRPGPRSRSEMMGPDAIIEARKCEGGAWREKSLPYSRSNRRIRGGVHLPMTDDQLRQQSSGGQ